MCPKPVYDPAKAETVTGQVVEVKEYTSMNGMRQGVGLTLKSGDKNVLIHLGPKFYLDQQTVKIAAGGTVEITGVKADRRGQGVFMAGQVKKNGEVLKLRTRKAGAFFKAFKARMHAWGAIVSCRSHPRLPFLPPSAEKQ